MYLYIFTIKIYELYLSLGERNDIPDAPFSLIVALANRQIPYQK